MVYIDRWLSIYRIREITSEKVISGLWTPYFVWCVPTQMWTRFLFEKDLFFRKWLRVATYFCLFLNGKQNKKENPKCDSLFGKDGLWKTKSRLGG